jgi:hypothetical protein
MMKLLINLRKKTSVLIKKTLWVILVLSIAVTLINEIYSDLSNSWTQENPPLPESFTIFGVGLAILAPLLFTPINLKAFQKSLLRAYLGYAGSLALTGVLYLFGKRPPSFIVNLRLEEATIAIYVVYILIALVFGNWNLYRGIQKLYKDTKL